MTQQVIPFTFDAHAVRTVSRGLRWSTFALFWKSPTSET